MRLLLNLATTLPSLPVPLLPRMSVLLVHRRPRVRQLLSSLLEDFNLVVKSASEFGPAAAQWSATNPPPFQRIIFDVSSVLTAKQLPLLTQLHAVTRQTSCTLLALLPLGATRSSLELVTDGILTLPLKHAHLFAAIQREQCRPSLPNTRVPALHPMKADSTVVTSRSPASSVRGQEPSPAVFASPSQSTPSLVTRRLIPSIPLSQLGAFASTYPLRILIAEELASSLTAAASEVACTRALLWLLTESSHLCLRSSALFLVYSNSINQRLLSKMLTLLD